MLDVSANLPLRHIRERRRHLHVERTFERRSNGGKDVRLTPKFEAMGAEKVRAMLSQAGLVHQKNAAKQWLESQEENQEESRSDGWKLKLTLAAATCGIGGALVFFAL